MTYTTDQFLQDLASTGPDQLLTGMSDEQLAGLARHALPDMATELLSLRPHVKHSNINPFSFLRGLLPAQNRTGEPLPPPGSPVQPGAQP